MLLQLRGSFLPFLFLFLAIFILQIHAIGIVHGNPHFLKVQGGVSGGKTFLSAQKAFSRALIITASDDASGRQKWFVYKLWPLDNGVERWVIKNAGGRASAYRYISCVQTLYPTKVDLWNEDDNSGRQQWVLTELVDGSYTIRVTKGRTSYTYSYLSCTSDGTLVDLYTHDDGSGRQRWNFVWAMSRELSLNYDQMVTVNILRYPDHALRFAEGPADRSATTDWWTTEIPGSRKGPEGETPYVLSVFNLQQDYTVYWVWAKQPGLYWGGTFYNGTWVIDTLPSDVNLYRMYVKDLDSQVCMVRHYGTDNTTVQWLEADNWDYSKVLSWSFYQGILLNYFRCYRCNYFDPPN